MDVKRALMKATMELLEKKPLEKISVREIVEKSDLGRSTFYKYFLDKYNLVIWVHNYIEREAGARFLLYNKPIKEAITACLKVFKDNINFYRNSLRITHVNSLYNHLYLWTYLSMAMVLDMNGYDISKEENDLLIRLYTDTVCTFLIDWVHKNDLTIDQAADILYRILPSEFLTYV